MPDIYYSKRSGAETERILDKANGIKINEQPTEDVFLDTIKIGDTIYKPSVANKKYIYIHIVELYFEFMDIYEGKLKTLITIDDREKPYVEGTEYLFFKSFGGGVLLKDMQFSQDFSTDCAFFCTGGGGGNVNGHFAHYEQSPFHTYPFTWTGGTARINEDTIYRLEVEEL